MNSDLIITKSIIIDSDPSRVWDVLINPEKIRQYFTGAETVTDWLPGSEIIFIHNYEQQVFRNRGIILKVEPDHLLSYTYWTAFSNTEDKPENYTTITYSITAVDSKTKLTLTQTNFKNKEWHEALETGWETVLDKMKEIAER